MSLPKDFLTQLPQYDELSPQQKEVFLEIFEHGKSKVQVSDKLHISGSALGSRLTGIYKKFSIGGSGPVKENKLREHLTKEYSKQKNVSISTPEHSNSDIDALVQEIREKVKPDEAWDIEQNFTQESDIDALVQEIREKVKPSIKKRCGTMKMLDMTQPIELTGERGIYTNVNILEQITGRRRLAIAELFQNVDPENFERCGLNQAAEKRVPGLEAVQRYDKLMVLGKPGAGKSTFLKYLAMQCIEALFQENRVPLFITLKDFAEAKKKPSLQEYIAQQFVLCGVDRASDKVEQLLRQGRALILLDGLDEVREEDTNWVLTQIREVATYFQGNQIIITCRIAVKEYTFQDFQEVEMAEFDKAQIAAFAQNWFRPDPVKAKRCIQKLEENQRIQELATNPLLLTLLCLVFGEKENFPAKRSELYEDGIDVLLKKWNAKHNIERDQVYKNLPRRRKEDLLSQIALTTFEQKDYFFPQRRVEEYIANFIKNLHKEELNSEVLRLDSEAVLKSIEAQHGLLVQRANRIYSFSHLTFHEYFTAREIVANNAYGSLIEHITEKPWREVFLLTVGMIRKADELVLLMKSHIDQLLANDEKLQQFLKWLDQKAKSVNSPYRLVAVRVFYTFRLDRLIHPLDENLSRDYAISYDPDSGINPDVEREYNEAMKQYSLEEEQREYNESYYEAMKQYFLEEKQQQKLELYFNETACSSSTNNFSEKSSPTSATDSTSQLNKPLHHELYLDLLLSEQLSHFFAIFIHDDFLVSFFFKIGLGGCSLIDYDCDVRLQKDLQTLEEQFNTLDKGIIDFLNQIDDTCDNKEQESIIKEWWLRKAKFQVQDWIEKLRTVIIQHRNIEHNWQFNEKQEELLQQYYYANTLLMNCLNSECYVSRHVRQEIEDTLLLPISEIEKRQKEKM